MAAAPAPAVPAVVQQDGAQAPRWARPLAPAVVGAAAQPLRPVPALTARVIDQTGTLSAEQRGALEAKLAAFEQRLTDKRNEVQTANEAVATAQAEEKSGQRALDDLGGQHRRFALLVPVGCEPVAHDLLVERGQAVLAACRVQLGIPVT